MLFRNALDLVEELELAEMKGELKKRVSQLAKYDLLVIDELGYLPMTRQARYNLFQLINSLYEYRSIILTTNKDFTSWGEFFHDDNVGQFYWPKVGQNKWPLTNVSKTAFGVLY